MAANSNVLIHLSLKSDVVDLRYFKFEIWKVVIRFQRQELENWILWQRLISFVMINSYTMVFVDILSMDLLRFTDRLCLKMWN